MEWYFGGFRLANILFQRSLAAVYLIAFIITLNQFPVLLGQHGFLPVPESLRGLSFTRAPTIYQFWFSDRFFLLTAWTGVALSALILSGWHERGPWYLSSAAWLALYGLYLSIVNAGQVFYAFGWEDMLLEAGFFAAFLGPASSKPSLVPVLALRWMLFRLILGAGLIKLRNDPCWHNLTCLNYHFETQPMPNPLSWYFHQLPVPVLKGGVFLNHIVEVIVPFGLFGPQPFAAVAGGLIIGHQLLLIASGNFAFLNYLTIVLCLTAFSNAIFKQGDPLNVQGSQPLSGLHQYAMYLLAALTILLSVQPTLNLLSRNQIMNTSYNPFRLVNTYGMFGTITRERYEIVIEGTDDSRPSPASEWKEYEFKGKPGNVNKLAPQIAPYHLRLDWLMWFLPLSVTIQENGPVLRGYELWFLRFIEKLLEGDRSTLGLLRPGPFTGHPPRFVRGRFYRYHFTTWQEMKRTGAWWKRELIGDYLPPVSLPDLRALGLDSGGP